MTEGLKGFHKLYPTTTFSFAAEDGRSVHHWYDGPTVRQVVGALIADPALVDQVLTPDPLLGTPGLSRSLGPKGAAVAVAALLPVLQVSASDLPDDFLGDLPGDLSAFELLELAEHWAQEQDLQDPRVAVGDLAAARGEVIHRLAADAGARTPLKVAAWAQENWENVVALVPESA